jgi:hypothetical protein
LKVGCLLDNKGIIVSKACHLFIHFQQVVGLLVVKIDLGWLVEMVMVDAFPEGFEFKDFLNKSKGMYLEI